MAHPSELERVTEASVRATLTRHGSICSLHAVGLGIVRVDVTAWPGFRLAVARRFAALAFEDKRSRNSGQSIRPA